MRALVRKDFRINWIPIMIGILCTLAPYAIVAIAVTHMPLWQEATTASAWAVLLVTGCHFSVMSFQAAFAMLCGHAIAAERGDRSIEFLWYLPPSRWQILLSKAVVVLGMAAAAWGLNLAATLAANQLAGDTDAARMLTLHMASISRLAAIGVLAAGAGWCASSMFASAGPPVALALLAPLVLVGLLQATMYLVNWPDEISFADTYFTTCWLIGAALFAAGVVYFLRRVEA
jgi:hypothetical protein